MKYMLLIYNNPATYEAWSEDERGALFGEVHALMAELTESGELLGGEALTDAALARTVRVRDGVPAVTDGPFVEAKEQFAGYLAVDCASLDRAVEIAARWPDAKHFAMEVRPMVEQPTAPTRKAVVERYFDGFRTSDHALILGLLTEDVAWDLPGFKHLVGKEAFDGEIENEEFAGPPTLVLDRLVEEGDTVVAIGTGEGRRRTGEAFRFAYCDAFTFADALIRRVESYVVPLP